MNNLPLKGITVLEFSQYLSGPSAGLRMADMGARVIKIERPDGGDACRQLPIKNLWNGNDSLLFHTINRNKESFAADLKNPDDLVLVKALIEKADVVTHNFRPGVMEKIGLDYAAVAAINPTIVYGEISGYGKQGPWAGKPGQDLLLQSVSGLVYTTGNARNAPIPFGLSIADSLCGAQLVQGILAGLIRKRKKGIGAHIEISLLESLLDFQFELLTTYFNSGQLPQRSEVSNGHPLLAAPYGIFPTKDGFLALAMTPLETLKEILECPPLQPFTQEDAFQKRDEIKTILTTFFQTENTAHWIGKLRIHDIWAFEVMNWQEMVAQEGYQCLKMEQEVGQGNHAFTTTRCPIRWNGKILNAEKPAPLLGEHNAAIIQELKQVLSKKEMD